MGPENVPIFLYRKNRKTKYKNRVREKQRLQAIEHGMR